MPFTLPPLPFPSDALEPNIDKMTMEIHHGKHHAAYVNNLNKALEQAPQLCRQVAGGTAGRIIWRSCRSRSRRPVRNNAGGHHNHSLFWEILNPAGKPGPAPVGQLGTAISNTFGSFDQFKEKFAAAATTTIRLRLGVAYQKGREAGDHLHRQSGQPGHGRGLSRSLVWMFGNTPIT